MANNVYIGARYVPVFDGTWSNSKIYEPLTIVEYNNSTYTSKKTVPAGTVPTNTNYWALTGNYNGQIAALDERVTSAENEIDMIKSPLSNVIVIGDSYANSAYGNWISKLQTRLGLDASHFRSHWESGAGFNDTATGFLAQLTTIVSGMTSDQKNAVTDVLVGGGLNDNISYESYTSGLVNKITAFANYVKTNLPNAKLHIAWIGYCLNGIGSVTLGNMLNGVLGYKIGSARNDIHYMSGTECALCSSTRNALTTLFKTDGIHPTDEGGNKIVDSMMMAFKNAYASLDSYAYIAPTAITSWTGMTQSGNNGFMLYEHDNTLDISYDGVDFTGSATITFGQKDLFSFTLPGSMYFNTRKEIIGLAYFIIDSAYQTSTYRLELYHDTATMRVIIPSGGTVTQCGFNRGSMSTSEFNK